MRVALISPPSVHSKSQNYFHNNGSLPIGIALLARVVVDLGLDLVTIESVGEAFDQYTPSPIEHAVLRGLTWDQIVARIPADTTVIGVTAMFTCEWAMTRLLIARLRQEFPKALIVIGGEHATGDAKNIAKYEDSIDAVFRGEGEEAFRLFLTAVRDGTDPFAGPSLTYRLPNGEVKETPSAPRMKKIDGFYPYWDQMPLKTYHDRRVSFFGNGYRALPILATRGCPYKCAFCSNPTMWGSAYITRSPKDVMHEIRQNIERYDLDLIEFMDLTATIKKSWMMELCREIKASGLKFEWLMPPGSRSEALDEELLVTLKETGLKEIVYAPDTGSPSMVKRIHKKVDLEKLLKSLRLARKVDLFVRSHVIIGFPKEKWWQTAQTLWYALRLAYNGADIASVYIFSPYIGSELAEEVNPSANVKTFDDYRQRFESTGVDSYTRVFSLIRALKKPREEIYALLSNITMVTAFFIIGARRPHLFKRAFRNLRANTPEGTYEFAFNSVLNMFRRNDDKLSA
jgi:anaerobic magnesium-protoporphyrin IX monomethyl ester cyclase